MNKTQLKQIAPVVFAGAVAALFGLGVVFFAQAYGGYLRQTEALEQMDARVRLATVRKNELVVKQRILDQTKHFVQAAHNAGLSPSKWTVYDVNLQESVGFEKADQILNQCADSRVAYFQPSSLQIKTTPKQAEGTVKNSAETGVVGDLTLSVQGKFVARQP